jgi:hypothetical protein
LVNLPLSRPAASTPRRGRYSLPIQLINICQFSALIYLILKYCKSGSLDTLNYAASAISWKNESAASAESLRPMLSVPIVGAVVCCDLKDLVE